MVNQASSQYIQLGRSKAGQKLGRSLAGGDVLYQFDQLPDAAHVRIKVVMALYGCSKATIWRWVKKSVVPAPVKRGGITAWQVGELRKALITQE